MKIAVLGLGTVGGGLCAILKNSPSICVKKVFSRHVPPELAALEAAPEEIFSDPRIDTVVETLGGVEPAYSYIRAALAAGKNVVTANKAVVAAHYEALAEAARAAGVSFRFSAAVGGGLPWLPHLERLKRFDTVEALRGIMNGTCNYILTRMLKDGLPFEEALSLAQEKGYAERDPSADIDGLDARRKLTLSVNCAFETQIPETQIPALGIRFLKPEDLDAAKALGCTLRHLALASRGEEGQLRALTVPCFLPLTAPEAAVWENNNRIASRSLLAGEQSLFGQGAGRFPTALNVAQDLADLEEALRAAAPKRFYQSAFGTGCVDNTGWKQRFYLRDASGARLTGPEDTAAFLETVLQRIRDGEAVFAALLPKGETL